MRRILATNRNEIAAKEAANFILNIQRKCKETTGDSCLNHISQLVILGYSLGAHIAASICRHLYDKTRQKPSKLIGECVSFVKKILYISIGYICILIFYELNSIQDWILQLFLIGQIQIITSRVVMPITFKSFTHPTWEHKCKPVTVTYTLVQRIGLLKQIIN